MEREPLKILLVDVLGVSGGLQERTRRVRITSRRAGASSRSMVAEPFLMPNSVGREVPVRSQRRRSSSLVVALVRRVEIFL